MSKVVTVTVSRAAVRHNVGLVRREIGPGVGVCGVVKADAYGHGLEGLWPVFGDTCDMMAVATADEALRLRGYGYEGPLLVLFGLQAWGGADQRDTLGELVRRRVTLTVGAPEDVVLLEEILGSGGQAEVHVEVDSGMHRAGVGFSRAMALIDRVRSSRVLRLSGLFSHFAMAADPDPGPTREQIDRFMGVLREAGEMPGVVRHMANSSGSMLFPASRLDMVRTGLILYGWRPEPHVGAHLDLRPALRVTARIMQVRDADIGDGVGYGLSYRCTRPTRIGLVPGGYADGYVRLFSNRACVRIDGRPAPVLGRVSMDQFSVDITDVPGAGIGSEVELVSDDAAAPNSVAALSGIAQTIPYEILTGLRSPRLDRVYTDD